MTNPLVKSVAQYLCRRDIKRHFSLSPDDVERKVEQEWIEFAVEAHIAIAAIEASETHRVVPVEPTNDMVELANENGKYHPTNRNLIRLFYRVMLAAAPKVTS